LIQFYAGPSCQPIYFTSNSVVHARAEAELKKTLGKSYEIFVGLDYDSVGDVGASGQWVFQNKIEQLQWIVEQS
jgi:hypothetical protein